VAGRQRPRAAIALLIGLFASYHALTLAILAPGPGQAALMLGAVVAAAGFWTWLRIRTGSVWPPLLAHTGAAMGYTLVALLQLASA